MKQISKPGSFLFKKIRVEGDNKNSSRFVTLAAVILPIIILAVYVILYHVDFFVWDELALVPLFEKLSTNSVTINDWLKSHNDHQILFPKLIMVGLLSLFDFQILPVLLTTILIASVGYLLIWKVLIREGNQTVLTIISVILSSFLFFSLLQWENFLRFWQIQLIMCIVFYICSTYFLFVKKSSTSNTILALIFAMISTFSFGNGIIGLFSNGFLLFFATSEKDEKKKKVVTYFLGIVIISILFFSTFSGGGGNQSLLQTVLSNIIKVPLFFLFFIGQVIVYPFYANKILAAFSLGAGVVGVAIFLFNSVKLFVNRRTIGNGHIFLFALSLWVVLSASVISLGRVGYGLETSVSSRYASFSALFWVSNLSLFLLLLNTDRYSDGYGKRFFSFIDDQRQKLRVFVILFMLVGVINSFSANWRFDHYERTTLPALSEYYELSGNRELLSAIYPDSAEFSKYPKIMAKIGITPFNFYKSFPYQKLERIDSDVEAPSGKIGNETSLRSEFDFDFKTRYYNLIQGKILSQSGVENTDVMVEFKNEEITRYFKSSERNSKKDTDPGFFALISYQDLPKGEYSRRILVQENGEWRYLGEATILKIK